MYPNYNQAEAYLKNFLRHGRRSFVRTKRYAYYQHSPSIRVIVFLLLVAGAMMKRGWISMPKWLVSRIAGWRLVVVLVVGVPLVILSLQSC